MSNKSENQVFYDTPYQNQTSASLSPEKLNSLFDVSEYLIFHLYGFKKAKQIKQFSPKPPFYNFLIFHKDVEKKVRENTTLFENLN